MNAVDLMNALSIRACRELGTEVAATVVGRSSRTLKALCKPLRVTTKRGPLSKLQPAEKPLGQVLRESLQTQFNLPTAWNAIGDEQRRLYEKAAREFLESLAKEAPNMTAKTGVENVG